MRFKKIIENFFSKQECEEFIKTSEAAGYEESLIRTRDGEVMNKDVRDNDRVIFDDTALSMILWERVKEHVPAEIGEWSASGLNERFRFYRYKDGQQFKPHMDGAFKRNENEVSMITMLIYLNEDFTGGATTMVIEYEDIVPKTGMVLLFSHKMLHAGRPVLEGTKYVLRTDVMYRKNN